MTRALRTVLGGGCSLAAALWVAGCSSSAPVSDDAPGRVPVAEYVLSTDGGGDTTRSVSVVLDQSPAGHHSLLAVSATEISRPGTRERFAQPNVACPNQIVGKCLITNCTSLKDVVSYPYGTVTPVAVGELSAKSERHTEWLAADGGTRARFTQASEPMFTPGELVYVTAISAGANTAPPFRRPLVVPRPVELLSPQVESAATTLSLKRDVPFEVRWSPLPKGAPEVVAVAVSDNVRTATCRFDASTGVAQVPTDVLSMLAPGPGFLTVHTLWANDRAINGWLVSVFARHVALGHDGQTAHFPTLEFE